MRPSAYYNEIDPYCAEWLRNLIAAGEIPPGDVDERSIEEVSADEIRQYTQCHFFAGIGGWALAARLAGWRDTDPIWTGSCPCQPFSVAGKRLADRDPRNLWPVFVRLIAECRPARVAGEQVASKAGRLWLAGVREDLEALGYAVGAADLCAAGVSAPHIRQRLWWVADAECARVSRGSGEDQSAEGGVSAEIRQQRFRAESIADGGDRGCSAGGMGNAEWPGLERHTRDGAARDESRRDDAGETGSITETGRGRGLSDAAGTRHDGAQPGPEGEARNEARLRVSCQNGGNPWNDAAWIPCADGKARRIEPGIEPLVTRLPGHVEQVRAYGNSIVPQEAAEVLSAFTEARQTGGVHGD